jgi:hypothetical protein
MRRGGVGSSASADTPSSALPLNPRRVRSPEDISEAALCRAWPGYYPGVPWDTADRRLALARGFAEWFRAPPPAGGGRFVRGVDWVGGASVVHFNYLDFKAACPYKDFEFALQCVERCRLLPPHPFFSLLPARASRRRPLSTLTGTKPTTC